MAKNIEGRKEITLNFELILEQAKTI